MTSFDEFHANISIPDDGPTAASALDKAVYRFIASVTAGSSPVSKGTVLTTCVEELDVAPPRVESSTDRLLMNGHIFEPDDEVYRPVSTD